MLANKVMNIKSVSGTFRTRQCVPMMCLLVLLCLNHVSSVMGLRMNLFRKTPTRAERISAAETKMGMLEKAFADVKGAPVKAFGQLGKKTFPQLLESLRLPSSQEVEGLPTVPQLQNRHLSAIESQLEGLHRLVKIEASSKQDPSEEYTLNFENALIEATESLLTTFRDMALDLEKQYLSEAEGLEKWAQTVKKGDLLRNAMEFKKKRCEKFVYIQKQIKRLADGVKKTFGLNNE